MLPTDHRERASILVAAWMMGLTLGHSIIKTVTLRRRDRCSDDSVTEKFMKRYIRKNALSIEIKTDAEDN